MMARDIEDEQVMGQADKQEYLGINIGGTECSVVLGDGEGQIRDRTSWATLESPGPEATVDRIAEAVSTLARERPPQAAGVAIGGPLDTISGEILGPPNLPGWVQFPLQQRLSEQLEMPVQVAHDAAACALAEVRFGACKGARSLVYLTCGTGFGAGIVLEGKMLQGAGGLHPEIGHWRLLDEGPSGFGRPGSAEGICSGPGLSRIAAWKFPGLWGTDVPRPETVSRLAADGHAEACAVVDFHARLTGRVCAMIAELLCPEWILLGSLSRHMGELWSAPVVRHYRKEVLPRIGNHTGVRPASLGERLQDLSALVVAMECVSQ